MIAIAKIAAKIANSTNRVCKIAPATITILPNAFPKNPSTLPIACPTLLLTNRDFLNLFHIFDFMELIGEKSFSFALLNQLLILPGCFRLFIFFSSFCSFFCALVSFFRSVIGFSRLPMPPASAIFF